MHSSHYYALSALFNGLFGAFVVYYIYLKNRTNPINRSFVYLGISITGWSLIYCLWCFAEDQSTAEFYVRRHMMFCAFIPAAFLHFSAHFTQNYERFKRFIFAAYILAAIYSFGMLTHYMISGTKQALFFKFWPAPGIFLPSHVVYFFIVALSAFALLISHYLKTRGAERHKAGWVLAAFGVGFGGGSINWFLWFDIPIPPTTHFFVGIMFAIIAYAMARYGLMDVDAVVEVLRTSRAATLGLMSSMINHELRNPLFIAKGKIEVQLDKADCAIFQSYEEEALKSREVLRKIYEQLNRSMDIVQRFSDFAKPVAQDKKDSVVLKEIWSDVLNFAGKELETADIRVNIEAAAGLTVAANRGQMEEVFLNLIMNACQALQAASRKSQAASLTLQAASFSPSSPKSLIGDPFLKPAAGSLQLEAKGFPEAGSLQPAAAPLIRIAAERTNGRVKIQIEDNGPGIPKENLRRIFEPFYSTKGRAGSGLGLYITKQLVERNAGKIGVFSRLGHGTKFTLELQGT